MTLISSLLSMSKSKALNKSLAKKFKDVAIFC
jgi:hypothetical protein